jgi:multidrug efflux pump
MLFWPGVPGEFMGMLPVTLIFVLSASLIVALIYLPVMGGVTGRMSRMFGRTSDALRARLPWFARAALVPVALYMMFLGAMQVLNPHYLLPDTATVIAGEVFGVGLFLFAAFCASVTLGAARIERAPRKIRAGHTRTPFGLFTKFIAGNPIMPLITIGVVGIGVMTVFGLFATNNNGVEFFVESEPEQATVYVRARGNISLTEADNMVRQVEDIVMQHPGVVNVFSFAGDGGLNTDSSGNSTPKDTVGQVQFETIPWEDRPTQTEKWFFGMLERQISSVEFDGDTVIDELNAELAKLPGFEAEILALAQGPASGKPVHLRLKGDDFEVLKDAAGIARDKFENTPALTLIEDSRPLPGIDWQIDVDVEKAGRYGADVATVGAMVQLVTRGVLLDTMRVDTSDEEIEIRVRLPEEDRVLSTLDTLKVRTRDGLVPLSNFISRKPVAKLAEISRVDQQRYFDVKADFLPATVKFVTAAGTPEAEILAVAHTVPEDQGTGSAEQEPGTFIGPNGAEYDQLRLSEGVSMDALTLALEDGTLSAVPINANERIAELTKWLETDPLPEGIAWEWTGDQEEQEESGAFLMNAFAGALGLMFIILLAQFNSFYNSFLVLIAVVLSTTGVLIGMMVMNQPFSIIMTGTGIVALAGIVVNNNIVLIDTYQEYSRYMPRIEAIVRTAEARIRPVLLTTITTMAGLAPMMFGLSLDFIGGGYTINSPTALWWKQLATAVVFGLGIATVLTLIVTPSMLALRVWFTTYVHWFARLLAKLSMGSSSKAAKDWALQRAARRLKAPEIIWTDPDLPLAPVETAPLKAAE